ncbi:MAG: iron-sulfur cluster-binding protein [Alphaproteobacteria bacterium]|nr:iron-sulfur cluster-binding protein [Alphaproteobacteria bacterium]
MESSAHAFPANVRHALADPQLQRAMGRLKGHFIDKRAHARARLPEFDALRDQAKAIKDHTLAYLDLYLERFETEVRRSGGHVHWCRDAAEARGVVLGLCREAGARTVTKGKTMIGEEIGLNPFLEANGIRPVETDLGEYIIQLAGEPPSHIIAPAVHKNKEQISDLFVEHHHGGDRSRRLDGIPELVTEARETLRARFLEADVGITGANLLIAETGQTVIVTNEGNGDLTQTLPRMHIVLASLEKVVPTMEDATTILRILARSATGQEFSTYTTWSAGPRRPGDLDGPEAFHVVLLDNGRSALLGSEFQDILRCIRCGACLNHCPIYGSVGGHAYGWVYTGPMGAVLSPALIGLDEAHHLPNASTFCGRCEDVCPMRIPLPRMLRHWREREFASGKAPAAARWGLGVWAWFATRPWAYRLATGLVARVLGLARRGRFAALPLAGGWTRGRDFPSPEGRTFHAQWASRRGR